MRRTNSRPFENCERLLESLKLRLRERRIERVFDIREVRIYPFDLKSRQFSNLFREAFQLAWSNSLAVGAGFDFQVNLCGHAKLLPGSRQCLGNIQPIKNLAIAIADDCIDIV